MDRLELINVLFLGRERKREQEKPAVPYNHALGVTEEEKGKKRRFVSVTCGNSTSQKGREEMIDASGQTRRYIVRMVFIRGADDVD